jgi:membrane protein YqaA with SNARE-associated domain
LKFLIYALRWQASTIPLAGITKLVAPEYGYVIAAIIANLIGAVLFYWFDKWLFRSKKDV